MEWISLYLKNQENGGLILLIGLSSSLFACIGWWVKSHLILKKNSSEAESQFRTDYLARLELVEQKLKDTNYKHIECEKRNAQLEARVMILESLLNKSGD